MTYYAHKPVAVLTYCFMTSVAFSFPAQAKTTFLPDYMEESWEFEGCAGGGEDYCLCQRSTNPKYHLSLDNPQCPRPKIFDKTCPHSNDWITECYCPTSYNQTCTYPYRGVGLICDGKYEECCDTRCPSGSQSSSCSYPYVTDDTTSTGCGETCYICRYGNDCNTGCSAGEEASYSGGYNDFNGQACVSCSTPPPPEPECTPYGDESGCNCYSCSDGCGGTRQCCSSCYTPSPDPEPEPAPDPTPTPEPEPEEPSCTDTCSSKGYKSSQPSGQSCSTTTVCGSTCFYNCKSNCTDTCSSKGYKSSQPSGQSCSTTTVCGSTCFYNCKANKPEIDCSWCRQTYQDFKCINGCISACEAGRSFSGKIGGLTCAIR